MKQRSSHISARSRIILVAILAIIVPTVILSLVGFQLIADQEKFRQERSLKLLRSNAELIVEKIAGQVESLEKELVENLPAQEVEQLASRLETFEKSSDIVEQAFLLSSSSGYIYPVLTLPPGEVPRGRLPAAEEIMAQSLMKEAWQKEFGSPADIRAALKLYEQHRDIVLEWHSREGKGAAEAAQAVLEVAGCLFKMKEYEAAMAEYSRLTDEPEYGEAAFRQSVLARYQVCQCQLKLERRGEAAARLLEFYGYLLAATPPAGEGPTLDYYRSRAVRDLDALQAGNLDAAGLARYQQLKRDDARFRERGSFLEAVKSWWQFRKKLVQERPPAENALQHPDPKELGLEGIRIAYLPLRLRPGDAEYALLGYKMNLRSVIQDVAVPKFREGDFGTASVIDEDQRIVYGPPVVKSESALMVSFPKPFSFWKLCVVDEPQRAEKLARKLTLVHTSLNVVIVCVIVAGVYLTIKDMNRELELSKLKSDFVSNVSHELKTPLALIRMFSETLQLGRVKDDVRRQEYYDVISRESERLTALINNVLDFSKIDAGRRTYDMQPASVPELVRNTLNAYRYELSKENFEVEVEIDEVLPEIVMDDDAISQALLNLLNNAVKYSRERKRIVVSARQKDGMLQLSVADSGIGIGKEDQKKIFDMFYRGSDEAVRSVRGTGLGLAITKHTAEAHGGTVTVESVKGEGSTFIISLPIRHAEEGR